MKITSRLDFLFATTWPRTRFVCVSRIVRGRIVLIFRGCDHLSDTTTTVERHSSLPTRDNAISSNYLRRVCTHNNTWNSRIHAVASVSLIFMRCAKYSINDDSWHSTFETTCLQPWTLPRGIYSNLVKIFPKNSLIF